MQLGGDPAEQSHRHAHGDFIRVLTIIYQTQDVPRKSRQQTERRYCGACHRGAAARQSPKVPIGFSETDGYDWGVPVLQAEPNEQSGEYDPKSDCAEPQRTPEPPDFEREIFGDTKQLEHGVRNSISRERFVELHEPPF